MVRGTAEMLSTDTSRRRSGTRLGRRLVKGLVGAAGMLLAGAVMGALLVLGAFVLLIFALVLVTSPSVVTVFK